MGIVEKEGPVLDTDILNTLLPTAEITTLLPRENRCIFTCCGGVEKNGNLSQLLLYGCVGEF